MWNTTGQPQFQLGFSRRPSLRRIQRVNASLEKIRTERRLVAHAWPKCVTSTQRHHGEECRAAAEAFGRRPDHDIHYVLSWVCTLVQALHVLPKGAEEGRGRASMSVVQLYGVPRFWGQSIPDPQAPQLYPARALPKLLSNANPNGRDDDEESDF